MYKFDSEVIANCRRQIQLESSQWYQQLTMAQKYSASELAQFGYRLAFIRGIKASSLAVFICDEQIAVVNVEGDINLAPNIQIRKS